MPENSDGVKGGWAKRLERRTGIEPRSAEYESAVLPTKLMQHIGPLYHRSARGKAPSRKKPRVWQGPTDEGSPADLRL